MNVPVHVGRTERSDLRRMFNRHKQVHLKRRHPNQQDTCFKWEVDDASTSGANCPVQTGSQCALRPEIVWIANPNIGGLLEAKMLQNTRRC